MNGMTFLQKLLCNSSLRPLQLLIMSGFWIAESPWSLASGIVIPWDLIFRMNLDAAVAPHFPMPWPRSFPRSSLSAVRGVFAGEKLSPVLDLDFSSS